MSQRRRHLHAPCPAARTRAPNTWTLEEFGDLVTAWELAASRPRDSQAQTLHDAVFKHFVALRGGSTRRNKAALTSKRSALKFSYLFALARIVSKGGDDERAAKDPAKPKDAPRAEPRPTRAARPAAPAKRKPPPAARPISSPCAGDAPMSIVHEMFREFELLQGGRNVRNLSGLATRRRVLKQSFSRVAAFDKIQEMNGDPKFTDLPAATRQNLIRSWKNANLLDLSADMYAELGRVIPLDTRAVALEDMRRAKGPNSASARGAEAWETPKRQRTARTLQDGKEDDEYSSSVFSSQPPSVAGDSEEEKAAIPIMVAQSRAQTDREEKASEPVAQTNYVAEKPAAPIDTGDIRAKQAINTSASGSGDMVITTKPSVGDVHRTTKATVSIAPDAKPSPPPAPSAVQKPSVPVAGQNRNAEKTLPGADGAKKTTPSSASRNPVPARNLAPKLPTISTQEATADKLVVTKSAQDDKKDVAGATALPTNVSKGPGRGKRKRKVNSDGPNGHLWENEELDILIKAWEKAAIMVCNSDPAERLSLNREMYREFVEMQGGSSVRNSTALAARRSSLKFSYAHIHSFNASQKAKGEPSYHEIPEGTRITVLRSWKNRNSVDLTKDMYEGLGRILAMDEKLAEIRSLRPPLPPPQKALKSAKDSAESKSTDNMSKTAKWSIEESSDLIKACADVMNVPSDKEQSATEPRFVLDSYEFIYFYDQKAAETNSLSWFELDPADRDPIVARMSRSYRSFNGLTTVDEDIYDVIDAIDAEIRLKLGETKKRPTSPERRFFLALR
ncbi:Avr1b-1 avirulence protein [Phytophthora cinnamomi]|uniref:Avr1b-1 avirulence protein n=1 Tax=Phytophthora cinnamomi TaxID=4785 RepID=UPI00355A8FBD|nr:Avr1b-1 avirulence protein [Phytophthora cinnamomi]